MSCREHPHTDWRALVAQRDESGEDPAGWDEAMARVDACGDCRRQALMADPSLVFRRLPRVETGPADVESMRQAVASLRRASRVTAVEETGPDAGAGDTDGDTGHRAGWRRVAAAALLAAAGLAAWIAGPAVMNPAAMNSATLDPATLSADGTGEPAAVMASGEDEFAGEGRVDLLPPSAGLTGSPVASTLTAEDLASRPVFEGLSQPSAADVYQVGEEDLLVVMVVDETLDI